MHNALGWINLHDDTILAQLFLYKDHLLRALDDEISAGVQRTLCHARELSFVAAGKHALIAPEHDRQTSDIYIGPTDNSLPSCVLDGDENGGAVSGVA